MWINADEICRTLSYPHTYWRFISKHLNRWNIHRHDACPLVTCSERSFRMVLIWPCDNKTLFTDQLNILKHGWVKPFPSFPIYSPQALYSIFYLRMTWRYIFRVSPLALKQQMAHGQRVFLEFVSVQTWMFFAVQWNPAAIFRIITMLLSISLHTTNIPTT